MGLLDRAKRKPKKEPETTPVDGAIAAAVRKGAQVEIDTTKPGPISHWTRLAQIVLAVAAVALGVMFYRATLGSEGFTDSANKKTTTLAAKTTSTTTTTTTTNKAGRTGKTVTVTTKVDSAPVTSQEVADKSRPSDTLITLIGVMTLALGLLAATLPRLHSFEVQGIKLDLASDNTVVKEVIKTIGKVNKAASQPSPKRPGITRQPEPPSADEIAGWTQTAVEETMRATRTKQIAALRAGADPTAIQLTDTELDGIVSAARPA